jgi:hypothetical protein
LFWKNAKCPWSSELGQLRVWHGVDIQGGNTEANCARCTECHCDTAGEDDNGFLPGAYSTVGKVWALVHVLSRGVAGEEEGGGNTSDSKGESAQASAGGQTSLSHVFLHGITVTRDIRVHAHHQRRRLQSPTFPLTANLELSASARNILDSLST